MKKQLVDRFPKAMIVCLAMLLITVAVMAGYGEVHATPNTDIAPASQPLPKAEQDASAVPDIMTTASSDELVWVRQEPAVINVNDDSLRYDATEPRFAGSFTEYTITETEIAMDTRYVDHGWEGYNVTIRTVFDRPPIVLNPPLRYKIKATSSHSGTHNEGSGSVGAQFWYNSPYGAIIEPSEVLGYYPFDAWWDGTSSKEWMINPPAILGDGDTFEMYASWWNCPPCNITWTYKAEPANAVERLGVEVVQPVVTYRGEEVPPGETYFPETCPDPARRAVDSCPYKIKMKDKARVIASCLKGNTKRVVLFLDLVGFRDPSDDPDDDLNMKELILNLALIGLADDCERARHAGKEYRLDLVLEEGAMQLSNAAGGLTTSVKTPLGTASAAAQGAFLTGYNPDSNAATFRSYSVPLTLQSTAGARLVLQPPHQVKLTSAGFGPVTELPHFFLPVVIRQRPVG